MKTFYIDKTNKNCDYKCNNINCADCVLFLPKAELYELAHELEYDKVEIRIPKTVKGVKKQKNPYLYKTDVEDWKDHHSKIWRLSLKLTPYEWNMVKRFFKYYKNRNLVGWGTTSPQEVTELIMSVRGDDETVKRLDKINLELQKLLKRHNLGYENDFFGECEFEKNEFAIKELKKEKRELLGF